MICAVGDPVVALVEGGTRVPAALATVVDLIDVLAPVDQRQCRSGRAATA